MRLPPLHVATQAAHELVEVTALVRDALRAARAGDGLVVVYVPHTTAGVTIQENADPDVVHDMLLWLNRAVPQAEPGFRHGEGNSDSHIKASLIGSGTTVLVVDGDLVLGTWQGVFFCEFDGPRRRTVHVQWLGK